MECIQSPWVIPGSSAGVDFRTSNCPSEDLHLRLAVEIMVASTGASAIEFNHLENKSQSKSGIAIPINNGIISFEPFFFLHA